MLNKLLTVIEVIAELIRRWLRSEELKKAQKDAEDLHDDPAGWLDKHFNGVQPSDVSGDAGGSDKAEAGKPKQD